MKSKVILFSVLFFCSKLVESIPFSEEHVIPTAYRPSTWQENQNAAGRHRNNFARTLNVNSALQNDNIPNYYQNQGRPNYDNNYRFNKNPTSLPPAKDVLGNYDTSIDGDRLVPYSQRVNSYSPRIETPQPRENNQKYINENWQSQFQNDNPSGSADIITDPIEQPLVTPVENSYRNPVQFQLPKYIPSANRQYNGGKRTYPPREPFYQELPSNSRFIENSELGSSGSSYENFNNDQALRTDIKDRKFSDSGIVKPLLGEHYNGAPAVVDDVLENKFGNQKYIDGHQSRPRTVKNFNGGIPAPTSDITDILLEKNENRRRGDNYEPRPEVTITAPINKYYNDFFGVTDEFTEKTENQRYNNMNNYGLRLGSSNNVPINNFNTAPSLLPDSVRDKSGNGPSDATLIDKLGIGKFNPNNAPPFNLRNKAPGYNYNDGSAKKIDIEVEKSRNTGNGFNARLNKSPIVSTHNNKNYAAVQDGLAEKTTDTGFVDNSGSSFGKPAHPYKNLGTPSKPVDTVLINSKNENSATTDKSPSEPSTPAPLDRNADKKDSSIIDHSRIHRYSFKDILKKAQIRNILSEHSKRFIIVHPNNTIEAVDKLDPRTQDKSKYRLVHYNQFDGANNNSTDNGISSTQSSSNVPANSATTLAPTDKNKLPLGVSKSSEHSNILAPIKSDEYPYLSTLSPIIPDHNTTRIPLLSVQPDDENYQQPANNSAVVSTSPSPDSPITSIIPIDLLHHNLSDVPPVTTTIDSPFTTPVPLDIRTLVYNEQDDASNDTIWDTSVTTIPAIIQKLSTTTVSSISSVLQTDDDNKDNARTQDKKKSSATTISPISSVLQTDDENKDNARTQDKKKSSATTISPISSVLQTDDDNKDNSRIQDKKKSSTTTISPISSVLKTDDDNKDEILIEIITKKNGTISNETIVIDQKNITKTATNNSHTNSDVTAINDDYPPVTTEVSVQNDVNTGDTSTTPGDYSLEYKQSETDIKITVSATNDTEADMITISIEVSESTDENSSDDTVVLEINTNENNKAGSTISNADDCKHDHSNNDSNKSKNVQIDVDNIKGDPIVWFKTTNQDFIHKLMSKNDTLFDVMYFFEMHNKTIIEREKHTREYCNGTVVIDTTEITRQGEDDPSPKTVVTQQRIEIEDYRP